MIVECEKVGEALIDWSATASSQDIEDLQDAVGCQPVIDANTILAVAATLTQAQKDAICQALYG